jgi:hypothetical protein
MTAVIKAWCTLTADINDWCEVTADINDWCKVTAVRNKGPEHARMFWNILEQLGDSRGSFNNGAGVAADTRRQHASNMPSPPFPLRLPPVGEGVSFRGTDTTGAVCIPHAAPVFCSFTPPVACIPDAAPCTARKPNERHGRKSTCRRFFPECPLEPPQNQTMQRETHLPCRFFPEASRKQQTMQRETHPPRRFLPRTL